MGVERLRRVWDGLVEGIWPTMKVTKGTKFGKLGWGDTGRMPVLLFVFEGVLVEEGVDDESPGHGWVVVFFEVGEALLEDL